jgi:hypothetical protein
MYQIKNLGKKDWWGGKARPAMFLHGLLPGTPD